MGMFDEITTTGVCPKCGLNEIRVVQTKDLLCALHHYVALMEDWETNNDYGKAFRTGLPVFEEFPLDKSALVWTDQAERAEAQATIPEEFHGRLNFVGAHFICKKCQTFVEGTIAIRDGKLVGGIKP